MVDKAVVNTIAVPPDSPNLGFGPDPVTPGQTIVPSLRDLERFELRDLFGSSGWRPIQSITFVITRFDTISASSGLPMRDSMQPSQTAPNR